jgi:hypothetical protein
MFYSVYSQNISIEEKVHTDIEAILKPYIETLLSDYKIMLNSFIIKSSGPQSEFCVHQDTTGLDEHVFSPVSFWIPLLQITQQNGAMCVIPQSHKLFSPYRSISFPSPYDNIQPVVRKYLKPIYMKAESVVFDNRLIHNSLPNISGKERVAIMSGVFPKEAKLLTCYKANNARDTKIELIEHEDDFLLTYPNFLKNCYDKPASGKTIAWVDDVFPPIDELAFEELCTNNDIKPIYFVKNEQLNDCVLISEPIMQHSQDAIV